MIKSINYWTFPKDTPIADAVKSAREAGFAAIEPTLEAQGKLTPQTDESNCRKLGQVIRDAGLQVASLACGLFWETYYTSPHPQVRERAYKLTLAGMDRARWLGAPVLMVVPGILWRGRSRTFEVGYDDALARSCDTLRQLAYEAEARGIIIALENVWNHFLVSPVEMRQFIDRISSSWVGVYFDIGNVLRYGVPQDWINILGRQIARVHLKDFKLEVGNADGFCPLGEGDVDFPAVMAALKNIGYDGPLTYEGPGDLKDISQRIDRIIAQ
ncbi:MAG: sugar phosphate isomerase/epimerase family protein [Planctomycetota bacterium]|jgi:hexulose-6-phosphate isomerase